MADEAKGKSRELSGGGGPDQLWCQVGAHTGSAPGGCPQTGWASPGPSAPQAVDKHALPPTERADLTDEAEKKKKNGLLLDANGTQMW